MGFENKAPKWDATGAEPSTDLQNNGFSAGYKPPASYFNYLFNRISAAITELQTKLSKVDNTADSEKPVSTAQATAIADAKKAGTDAQATITSHTGNKSNPHGVTAAQVGLGNVPNVATNDQTPTYTVASSNAALTSGEKLSVSMGKIAKAVSSLISHLSNTSNPHNVTKSQVGLGNVPNVATNDQTPTYSDTSTLATLSSGEKLNVAFQKIKLAITTLINHVGNKSNPHAVTAEQAGALPIVGGELTGNLTVIDNFNVNKTFDGVEYKTYARPINYSIGNNGDYSTGLIHYKENTNQAQLMFNKDGVMLRDNVNAKAYKLFGQHNAADMPFLPLAGGTLSGNLTVDGASGDVGYVLKRSADNSQGWLLKIANAMQLTTRNVYGDNTNERRLYLYDNSVALTNALRFLDATNGTQKLYDVYGTHNKPTGTYTGNGSKTSRTINTNGIGNVLVIWSEYGVALVTPSGGFYGYSGSSFAHFPASGGTHNGAFSNGTLTLAATHDALNRNGVTYRYYVL